MTCLYDLFQPPVVRQYIQGGRLFREREERTPDRFELFLDLVLVGIVHQLAESASESTSGATIAKVILTFCKVPSLGASVSLRRPLACARR